MKLAMDIAADGDRRIDRHDIALFDQELTRLVAQFAHLGFGDQAAGPQLLDRPVTDSRLVTERTIEVQRTSALPVEVAHDAG